MTLRERLEAELTDICPDERAWVPLRRGFVDELLNYLLAAETFQAAAMKLAAMGGASDPVQNVAPVEPPKKTAAIYKIDDKRMKALAISELQRMAIDGVAPTHVEFNAGKDPQLPTLSAILYRLNTKLVALAKEAGLQHAPMGRPSAAVERAPALIAPVLPVAEQTTANGHAPI